ncbi:hypothetical protein JCM1840_000397 [Sporobolomyces johnsonii]
MTIAAAGNLEEVGGHLGGETLEDADVLVVQDDKANTRNDTPALVAPIPDSDSSIPAHPLPFLLSGIGLAPRIQCRFHFNSPFEDPLVTPLLSSLTASSAFSTLPRVMFTPDHLAAIQATTLAHPNQFRFECTINDAHLATLLSSHPNRLLVDSILAALHTEGFEPPHNGCPALGDDPLMVRFPKEARHQDFIA